MPLPEGVNALDIKTADQRMAACRKEAGLRRRIASGRVADNSRRRTGLMLQIARLRRNQNDWEGAATILRNALRRHPGQPLLWQELAEVLARTGDHEAVRDAVLNLNRYRSDRRRDRSRRQAPARPGDSSPFSE